MNQEPEQWDCCGRPVAEHGRGGHCPTLKTADTIPTMKLIRWIVKCPWCDWISEESSEPGFARDALRRHLIAHFEEEPVENEPLCCDVRDRASLEACVCSCHDTPEGDRDMLYAAMLDHGSTSTT